MMRTRRRNLLTTLLAVDAATCAGMGALLTLAARPLAAVVALPAPLLFWAGLALLPVAAFMGYLARTERVPGWAVLAVVGGNFGWVAASVALPLSGAVTPNPLGWAFILAQAAVVAVLACLEWMATRRCATPAWGG